MVLGLEDISEESYGVCFESFIALLVEMGKGGLISWMGLSFDDCIILLSDLEDIIDLILAYHAVDLIVEVIHKLV